MVHHAASAFQLFDKCRVNLETDKAVFFTILRQAPGFQFLYPVWQTG
jgi:hypothetical protein